MNTVNISNSNKLKFVLSVLNYDSGNPFDIRLENNNLSIHNDVISDMLQRCEDGETYVLPHITRREVLWLVLNDNLQRLSKNFEEIKDFIVPVMAETRGGINRFKSTQSEIGYFGNMLYPMGYKYFSSPSTKEIIGEILIALKSWIQTDSLRPDISYQDAIVSAYTLRSKFRKALTLQNWQDAKDALVTMQQGHYISDDNCQFLKVQYYSTQGKWSEIWDSSDYPIIAGLDPLPSAVRGAMITAFYCVVLKEYDEAGDNDKAIEAFRKNHSRLGTLVNYRLGLKGEVFNRFFAYQAMCENSLDKLNRIYDETYDVITRDIIEKLKLMVKKHIDISLGPHSGPLDMALVSFSEKLYDDAYLYILGCEPSIKRTQLLLGIAAATEELELCEEAFNAFSSMSEGDKQEVQQDLNSKSWLRYVLFLKQKSLDNDNSPRLPLNWGEWFRALIDGGVSAEKLFESLGILINNGGTTKLKNIGISEVEEYLIEIATSDTLNAEQKSILKLALQDFASFVLNDEDFPNAYAETLYEYLIECLGTLCNKNGDLAGFILRLCEGLMRINIEQSEKQWSFISNWFSFTPTIKLSFYILEGLNLFRDYGVPGIKLIDTWYNWSGMLVDSFTGDMKTQVKAWVDIGEVIHGDYAILNKLKRHLTDDTPENDLLEGLNDSVITIYSCREKAAIRASQQIVERNSKIKVRVCSDDSLTDKAKNYASNSDIVIIVTACTSHALFYGITPYIKNNPLYPRSSGETGIVEALEDYAHSINKFS